MKTIFITGATDGLGRALAFELANKNYQLILHGRSPEKGEKLIQELEASTGNSQLHYLNADFAEIAQIRQLAKEVLGQYDRLDVLINNAGLGVERARRESEDGLEMIFQVDYLSTYILSKMLLPLLEKSAPARIINVSSAGQAPIDFSDPLLEHSWDGTQAYCQAKLAQIALGFEMAKELGNNGVTVNSLHPASMMPTKIVTHMFTPMSEIEDGVRSVVKLATDPGLEHTTGKYFFQTQEQPASKQAYDTQARMQLMELSRELTGV